MTQDTHTPANQVAIPDVEAVARAIHTARGFDPDTLHQHNFEGDYPEDERREYQGLSGETRTMLFHKGWRREEKIARAAILAIPQGDQVREALADRAPTLCGAFRTTVSEGQSSYRMVFQFPSLEALHRADDEWLSLRSAK